MPPAMPVSRPAPKSTMKNGSYWKHAAEFKPRLLAAIPREELRLLHEKSAARHFAVLARQIAITVLAAFGALAGGSPLVWLPCSIVLGFCAFNFTVLLHEVVHSTVFRTRRPGAENLLGWLYALPSGISKSQFTRWHLDHHNELGSDDDDPKRHWLTPKVVRRWYKALYCTPALFPIYFRAAAREAASYPSDLRRQVKRERLVTIAVHVAVMATLLVLGGTTAFVRLYAIPYFAVFPIAFTVNRLGQHYDIDPRRPANWGTLMRASRLTELVFLYSSYHLEHHYFPSVPLYNLRRVHFALADFYRSEGIRAHTYREVLWGWFVVNRTPHTDWSAAPEGSGPGVAAAVRPARQGDPARV